MSSGAGSSALAIGAASPTARALALGAALVALAIAGVLLIAVPAAWLGGPDLLAPSGIALAAGVRGGLWLRSRCICPTPHDVALAYDQRAGLKERLSTAISELRNVDSDVRELQHADAVAAAQRLRPDRAVPYGVATRDLVVMALAAAALAAGWSRSP